MNTTSITQSPNITLPTKYTRRLAIIVRNWEDLLLEHNEQYNNTSFINTTLSEDANSDFTLEELTLRAKNLVQQRTWYTNIHFAYTLNQSFTWTFHKPDKDYNECWLYDWTVLIFDMIDSIQWPTDPLQPRSIIRRTANEINLHMKQDGSSGSSGIIRQIYQQQFN